MATPTFPSFARLPAELRLAIWEAALPDPIGKPLFFWRRSSWCAPFDNKWNVATLWLKHGVHPRDICLFAVEIPHLRVNWEAHQVAEDWLHRQGLRVYTRREDPILQGKGRSHKNNTTAIYRVFDPERDIVFIPAAHESLWRFWDMATDLREAIDGLGEVKDDDDEIIPRDLMRNVALPQTVWFSLDDPDHVRNSRLGRVSQTIRVWCRNLYLVVDVPTELVTMVTGEVVREKWELECLEHFPRASWAAKTGWAIAEGSPASCASIAIYQGAKQLLQLLAEWELEELEPQSVAAHLCVGEFQIQFARAVRK